MKDPSTQAPYVPEYYSAIREASRRSAEVIVPLVLELAHPASVVDVGCGTGAWLAIFKENGVEDIYGIDGSWLRTDDLEIPESCFLRADLQLPLDLPRRFDLVVSLEVAEHLPAESAEGFIRSLTQLGDLVLFSAAIPGQGGKQHLNEQWPDYWASLFRAQGYEVADCIRPRVWGDNRVEYWYAQNTLLFCRQSELGRVPALAAARVEGKPRSLVHPQLLAKLHAKVSRAEGRQAKVAARLAQVTGSRWWRLGIRLGLVRRSPTG